MKDFFNWRKPGYPPKKFQRTEDKNWSHRVIFSYWIHHQPYDISEEGSHTWRWNNYSIKDRWSAWYERRRPIGYFQSTGSPIRNRSSPGFLQTKIMMYIKFTSYQGNCGFDQSTCQINFVLPQDNSDVLSLKMHTISSTPVQIITHH
jgi:hypothetical protein